MADFLAYLRREGAKDAYRADEPQDDGAGYADIAAVTGGNDAAEADDEAAHDGD